MPEGSRGQINGLSTTVSGIVAITLGLGLRAVGGEGLSTGLLAWLFVGGGTAWLLAALVYSKIREPVSEVTVRTVSGPDVPSWPWVPGWLRWCWYSCSWC